MGFIHISAKRLDVALFQAGRCLKHPDILRDCVPTAFSYRLRQVRGSSFESLESEIAKRTDNARGRLAIFAAAMVFGTGEVVSHHGVPNNNATPPLQPPSP